MEGCCIGHFDELLMRLLRFKSLLCW